MPQKKKKPVQKKIVNEHKTLVKKNEEKKKNLVLKVIIIGAALLVLANALFFTQMRTSNGTIEVIKGEDGTRYTVEPEKLVASGLPKDGIPPINAPEFVSVSESSWIKDEEYVLVLEYNGVTRAYPVQILLWHEIVNDNIGEEELLITYCPLCLSGKAYVREDRFGTAGKVYNSNGVMYDSTTETYWSQFEGIGLVGERAGEKLDSLPLSLVRWADFKEAHPASEVLSKNTGYRRPYGTDPYTSYYIDDSLFFKVEQTSDLLPLKEIIHGIEINGEYRAYPASLLAEQETITDSLGGIPVRLEQLPDGQISVINKKTEERIVHTTSFWFVWYAFHPETTVYEA